MTLNNNFFQVFGKLFFCVLAFMLLFCSCDGHHEEYQPALVGQVLCTDGHVLTYDEMKSQNKEPIAVVFYGYNSVEESGSAYAVYLYDLSPAQFCDSIGVAQGSSADITALDGKENTFAIMSSNTEVHSPMADRVFEMWKYGQSAYIGSVQQNRLLYANKKEVNAVIKECGGDPIPDKDDECWYWSSTEVSGAETGQAWLVSLESGVIQETPKTVTAKLRPMVTVYNP